MVLALEADRTVGHHGAVDEGCRGFGEVCGGEFVERVRAEGGGKVDGFAQGVGGEVPGEDAGGLGVCYGVSEGECVRYLKAIFGRGDRLPVGEAYFRSPWWSWLAENIT